VRKVFKYRMPSLEDIIKIKLPIGSDILHVNVQNKGEELCIWALVDPNSEHEKIHTIRIAGTGHPIEDAYMKYINTFTCMDRKLWFHAFEIL
jgi:hypothetical protein